MSGADFFNASFNSSIYLNNSISIFSPNFFLQYAAIYPTDNGKASVDNETVSYVRSAK